MIAFLTSLPYLAGNTEEAAAQQKELAAQLANETVESQGKIFLALKYSFGADPGMLGRQSRMLNDGDVGQRQRAAVLAYEFGGKDDARAVLDVIDELAASAVEAGELPDLEMSEPARAVQAALRALYAADPSVGGDSPADDPPPTAASPNPPKLEALTDDERALLVDELGFLGEVATNPPSLMADAEREQIFGPVGRLIIIATVFFILFALAALGGFVGLIVILVQALSGRMSTRVPQRGRYTGVYVETVALWAVVFFGSQLTIGPVVAALLPVEAHMLAQFVIFMATLLVLCWPVVRGVPWAVVRQDIGWTAGERPALEPVIGVAGYFMMIPIMVVGIILTFLLLMLAQMFLGDELAMPIHPIAGEAGATGIVQLAMLLLLASVAAPIVEETIFRGLMYRHLRDSSRRMSPAGSIIVSALVSAFIFAIIHPEGILGTPAKASIGIALAFMREWRGTLIPSMIMHGLSNAVVITLLWGMMNI
jgi:membrane protease YdiL (CAAX protease family)